MISNELVRIMTQRTTYLRTHCSPTVSRTTALNTRYTLRTTASRRTSVEAEGADIPDSTGLQAERRGGGREVSRGVNLSPCMPTSFYQFPRRSRTAHEPVSRPYDAPSVGIS